MIHAPAEAARSIRNVAGDNNMFEEAKEVLDKTRGHLAQIRGYL